MTTSATSSAWLDDGTLAWAGRRGVVIIPGWEYNERTLVNNARLKLKWYGSGQHNEPYLQWVRLIVERVRAMLDDNE